MFKKILLAGAILAAMCTGTFAHPIKVCNYTRMQWGSWQYPMPDLLTITMSEGGVSATATFATGGISHYGDCQIVYTIPYEPAGGGAKTVVSMTARYGGADSAYPNPYNVWVGALMDTSVYHTIIVMTDTAMQGLRQAGSKLYFVYKP